VGAPRARLGGTVAGDEKDRAAALTAIAAFSIQGHPIVLADILVSGSPGSTRVTVPTSQSWTLIDPSSDGTVAVALQQKLVIVGDHLVIGYTGMTVAAQAVIKELIKKNSRERLNAGDLMAYLKSLDDTIRSTVTFVGRIVDEHEGLASFGWGHHYRRFDSPHFGRVSVAGSGSDDLEQYLCRDLVAPPVVQADAPFIARPVGVAITATGYLLERDIDTARSLTCSYGAGYEIATLSDNRFVRLGDTTYVFWNAALSEDLSSMVIAPHLVFKYTYSDDVLLIWRAQIRSDSWEAISDPLTAQLLHDGQPFLVTPLCRRLASQEREALTSLPSPDMNSRVTGNYFLINHPNHGSYVRTKVLFGRGGSVRFDHTPGASYLLCDREFLLAVASELRAGPPCRS
jgi:hypothetical protein